MGDPRSPQEGATDLGSSKQTGLGQAAQDQEWGALSGTTTVMFCDRRQVTSPLGASVSTSVKEGGM